MIEGNRTMSDELEEGTRDVGTALFGTGTARGVFHAPVRCQMSAHDSPANGGMDPAINDRVHTRKVGIQYVFQALLNSLPLLLVDIFALTATISACRMAFFKLGIPVGVDVSDSLIAIASGFVLLNIELSLYPGVRLSPVEEFRRLIVSVTCMFIVWAIGVALLTGDVWEQIWFLLAVWLACLVTLPIGRGWARYLLGRFTPWGIPVFVCGDDAMTVRLFHWLNANRQLGMRPVGVIADRTALGVTPEDGWYLGGWQDAHQVAIDRGVYWAVVVPPERGPVASSTQITDYLYTIPNVHVVTELTGLPDRWSPQQMAGLSGIHLQQNLMLPFPRLTKRVMDLVASLIGGVLLLPLLFYIAVAVKMSSRGPILYGHDRIGKDGRHFKAWKFRSMFENSSDVLEYYMEQHPELKDEWEKDHKLRYDPRVTRIGRFIRKTSLDELPQIWNVFRGEMSLVGPRPIVTAEIAKYGPYYGLYTMVTPGITGLWQVSGRNNTTYDERVQLDAYYVRNWSPWLDMYLLIRTIRIVLFADGAY
jgi:Undecaprenyl-phosphate galactose phosphotransferase WbaP